MYFMKQFFYMVTSVLILTACNPGSPSSSEENINVDHVKVDMLRISDQFDDIFVNKYNRESLTLLADSIVIYVNQLSNALKGNPELVKYYFLAGETSMKISKGELAIKYFEQLIQEFPEDELTDKSMYFIAYTYENVIQDIEKAKEVYKQLYKEKPNSDWGENARSQVLFLNSITSFSEENQETMENVK